MSVREGWSGYYRGLITVGEGHTVFSSFMHCCAWFQCDNNRIDSLWFVAALVIQYTIC